MIFLLISSMLIIVLATKFSWKKGISAGFFLALSAYFRSQFEIVVVFFTITAVLVLIFYLINSKIYSNKEVRPKNKYLLKIIGVVVLTANIFMIPWRIHNFLDVKSFSWVFSSNQIYLNASKTEAELNSVGANFIVRGGGYLACHLEPNYCGQADKKSFYRVFINHPIRWIGFKLSIIGDYWFSSLQNFTVPTLLPSKIDFLYNSFFLFMICSLIPLLWLLRKTKEGALLLWKSISFFTCLSMVLTFAHLEARYLYSIKLFSLFIWIILISLLWKRYKKHLL